MTRLIKRTLGKSRTLVRLRLAYWRVRFHFLSRYSSSWKRAAPDGLPIPPPELRFLISGIPDYTVGDFLDMGRHCVQRIQDTLLGHGVAMQDLRSILDFGCGCGRTLRHLAHLKNARLHGTDYNPVLIKWCRPNLAFARFEVNRLDPPLVYADQTFDLVYAFSVFTHLPEVLQHSWMDEMARIIKPGGHLVLSTMPEVLLPDDDARSRFRDGQLVIVNADGAGTNACAAFQPYAYMEKKLARAFKILEFIPGGVGQDVWLLRRAAEPPISEGLSSRGTNGEGSRDGHLGTIVAAP